jgi:hypothetical protein
MRSSADSARNSSKTTTAWHHDRRVYHGQSPERPQTPLRPDVANGQNDDATLFAASPSLWAMVGTGIVAVLFLILAWFLRTDIIADMVLRIGTNINPEYADKINVALISNITGYIALGIILLTVGNLLLQILKLKTIHYTVSADRIEFTRGILNRRIDNLDMFRVTDIRLHRSLLDCFVGIGSVTLVTKDESDPFFDFEKVARPKHLYDIIKKASLEADRKQGVVHLD